MTTPVPAMTDTPPFPALADRAAGTYNSKAYAFGAHMSDTFNAELVAVATNVLSNATDAAASAVAAGGEASDAAASATAALQTLADTNAVRVATEVVRDSAIAARDTALTHANTAEAARDAAIASATMSGDAVAFSDANHIVKGSADATKRLRFEVDGFTTGTTRSVTVPNKDGTMAMTSDIELPSVVRSGRTANTILGVADKTKFIDITSGTFTQTFAACATLGNGWYVYYRNSGTGTITADPNGSETIDGVTSGTIPPGMTLLITCDGTALHAMRVGPQVKQEVITSGTSWTAPLGVRPAKLRMTGGGQGGGGGATTAYGNAGFGGDYIEATVPLTPGTSYAYTVGAGGGAGSPTGTGVPGVATSAGASTFTANGVTFTSNATTGGALLIPGGSAFALGDGTNGGLRAGDSFLGRGGATVGGVQTPASGYGAAGAAGLTNDSGEAGRPGVIILEY